MSTTNGPPITAFAHARRLTTAIPDTRNRYVDFLRAVSILAVVVGHWLIAAPYIADGEIDGINLLAHSPWTQWLTWVFQVMPVFFIVGGYSWRSRRSYQWDAGVGPRFVALAGGALVVDLLTASHGWVGLLNIVFVWAGVSQLGTAWHRGRIGGRSALPLAAITTSLVIVLVSFGSYPISMVGVPGAVETNNSPPTLALMMFGLAQTSLLVAMEPAARRMLDRARVRTMTVLINRMIMTLYLWHLTAMVLLIGASMLAGGIGFGIMPGTGAWWMTRPLWLLVVSVATVPFMMIFRRFDTLAPLRSGATIRPVIALGVMASGSLGMALLAGNGISGSFFGINIVAVLLALGTVGALRRLSHG